ncbi:helix-turn-helix domain-containing protein [Aerosakkonemataceae cyanobacterium BLCC-F154]|uniref:Helix-turn-helix domain-containing protein n=1 Tax=Floridaenema fluviatile BLCC-F154 TaxID=3153640 RepID=A0ABV4YBT3_9CYAN
MKLPKYRIDDPILPSESDIDLAQVSSEILAEYLQGKEKESAIALIEDENNGKVVEIPALAMQLLLEILVHTAKGKPVKITPYTRELEIYQAAEILGVSDRYLWNLLDSGEIPYKIVRNTRRMLYEDVINYKKQMRAEQMKGMDELVAESEAIGLYD